MMFYNNQISNFKSNYFFYIIIFLFIFSLISGPFIPDFIVTISSIIMLFYYKVIFSTIKNNQIYKFLFIFWVYIIFSSFYSQVFWISFYSSITFLRFLLFILVVNIILTKYNLKNFIIITFIFLYSLLFFDSLLQVLTNKNIFGYPLINDRVSSFFGDELIMGSFFSRTYFIFLYLLFDSNLKKKLIIFVYTLLITLFCVVVSAERTALFMYLLYIFFSLFFFKKKDFYKLISLILICLCLFLFLNKNSYKRIFSHTYNQVLDIKNNKISIFSYRHQLHFETALNIFYNHKIFGGGIKSFRYLCDKENYSVQQKIIDDNKFFANSNIEGILEIIKIKDYNQNDVYKILIKNNNEIVFEKDTHHLGLIKFFKQNKSIVKKGDLIFSYYEFNSGCNTHPHNFYFQFLSELGIVGFVFLIFVFIYICYNLAYGLIILKKTSKIDPQFILFAGYFAILFPLIPSGNFFNNYLCLLTFLPLCFFKLCKKY